MERFNNIKAPEYLRCFRFKTLFNVTLVLYALFGTASVSFAQGPGESRQASYSATIKVRGVEDTVLLVSDTLKGDHLYGQRRVWRIEQSELLKHGSTDLSMPLNLSFDIGGLPMRRTKLRLVIDDDGSFGEGTKVLPVSAIVEGSVITFKKVKLKRFGAIALIADHASAPGGISSGLVHWLDAQDLDGDGTAEGTAGETGQSSGQVSTWTNKGSSGNFTNTAGAASGTTPDLKDDQINFNSVIEFNESVTSDYLGAQVTDFPTSDITQFVVIKSTGSGDGIFSYALSASSFNEFLIFSQENINPFINGSAGSSGLVANDGSPKIVTVDWTSTGGARNVYVNGDAASNNPQTISSGTDMTASGTIILAQEQDSHGGGFQASQAYIGQMAEVITYSSVLSASDRQNVESYLALKFGITLDQTSGTDYTAGSNIVIWDYSENTTYVHDIAGIGKDSGTDLLQEKSKSENSDAIVTIEKNSAVTLSDNVFLIWSNDNGSASAATSVTISSIDYKRITRKWRVQEKNDTDAGSGIGTVTELGNVDVSFDLAGIGYNSSAVQLIIDDDGTFGTGTTISSATASFDGSIVTFSDIDLDDGDYFSLIVRNVNSPGGVDTNLKLWLKADAGTNTTTDGEAITSWGDQSDEGNSTTDPGGSGSITYQNETADLINFNPVLRMAAAEKTMRTPSMSVRDIIAVTKVESTMPAYGGLMGKTNADFGVRAESGADSDLEWIGNGSGGTSPNSGDWVNGSGLSEVNGVSSDLHNGDLHISYHSAASTQSSSQYYIGGYAFFTSARFMTGDFPELIVYSSRLSTANLDKVQSYLAVKYGITLDQSSGQDYTASDGGVVWDYSENTTYINDIAAIGRDDESGLLQKQSKSQNADAIVTIGLDDDTTPDGLETSNALNDGTFSADDSFLFWSNDGASIDAGEGLEEIDRGLVKGRLNREWRVQEVGTIGTVTVQFDVSGIAGPSGTGTNDESKIVLMVDADGDFSSGASVIFQSFETGGDDLVNFRVDFSDGDYFTLGSSELNSLPVEMTSFEVECFDNHIGLVWSTASEVDNSFFKVQRSKDGLTFEDIAIIEGSGSVNGHRQYTYDDRSPLAGSNYYRLADVNGSGNEHYSEVLLANYTVPEEFLLNVYPNPVVSGSEVNLEISSSFELKSLHMYDARGKLWITEKVEPAQPNQRITISTQRVPKGLYTMLLEFSEGRIEHRKLIVKN